VLNCTPCRCVCGCLPPLLPSACRTRFSWLNWLNWVNLTRSRASQIASDGLKGRVFDVSLADLQKVRRCSKSKRALQRVRCL